MSKPFISAILLLTLTIWVFYSQADCKPESYDIVVPDHYEKIQDAIQAATPGQTIYVKSGIYQEYLVINKSISITGENRTSTVIEGNRSKVLIKILADNISFSGFSLRSAGTGLMIKRVADCRIEDNSFADISIAGSLTGGMGIYVENCRNITVIGNRMTDVYYNSIYFRRVHHSAIAQNVLIPNTRWSQPIFLESSHNNLISWNELLGTPDMNEGGVGLLRSNNNTISYNEIQRNDWCGVSIRESKNVTIKGNNIARHSWWGIKLTESKDVKIYLNNLINNNMQILLQSIENVTWHQAGHGNFWSDYTGRDEDSDGIGDIPYTYKGEEIDPYPLAGRVYSFEIRKEDDSLPLEIISNSTVEDLEYLVNNTSEKVRVQLVVSGPNNTCGFCLTKLPNRLLDPPYNVTVNGRHPLLCKQLATSENHTTLYISYRHENKQQEILIVNETISILMFSVLIAMSLLLIHRRKS